MAFGVPGDGDLGWAFNVRGHVTVGILYFSFPLYIFSAIFPIALNTDVVEGNFLIWWVMTA